MNQMSIISQTHAFCSCVLDLAFNNLLGTTSHLLYILKSVIVPLKILISNSSNTKTKSLSVVLVFDVLMQSIYMTNISDHHKSNLRQVLQTTFWHCYVHVKVNEKGNLNNYIHTVYRPISDMHVTFQLWSSPKIIPAWF